MTEKHEDTLRLEFIAKSLNTHAGSVHIAARQERKIVQMYSWLSKWVELSMGEEVVLDDLRMLLDQAIEQAKEQA